MKKISKIIILFFLQVLFLSHAAYAADQVFFYVTDPVGTPLAMTDPSGNIVWKADYKPFGEENSIVADQKNNKEFVGKEKDEETGIYYFNARYMESRVGRFVAVDPVRAVDPFNNQTNEVILTDPQHLNNYAYAQNNPVNFIDPSGLLAEITPDEFINHVPIGGGGGGAAAEEAGMMRAGVSGGSGVGRRGALRQALRDNNVPTSKPPTSQCTNTDRRGNRQPGRQYLYKDSKGNDVIIRDDARGHTYPDDPTQNIGPHFNGPNGTHYVY